MSDWEDFFAEESGAERESKRRPIPIVELPTRDKEREERQWFKRSPESRTSRTVLYQEQLATTSSREKYKLGFFSVFFVVIAVIFNVSLMIKYAQQDITVTDVAKFLFQNAVSFIMVGVGIALHFTFVGNKLLVGKLDREGLFALGIGAFAFAVVIFVQAFIQAFVKLSVSPVDIYLIFISLAVAEEICFRYGIQASIESVVEQYSGSRIIAAVVSVLSTSLVFMFVHFGVYVTWTERLVILGTGAVFGGFFAWTRNTDTCVVAHFLVNLIAGYLYISRVFGGF